MLKYIFVTGTDTAVGKTVVSQALLQHLAALNHSAVGYKPVATGDKLTAEGWRNQDALLLQALSDPIRPYREISPVTLPGDMRGIYNGEPMDFALMSNGLHQLSRQAQTVIIDGHGGWQSILPDYRSYSEWVVHEKLPVVMVIGIQTGCINHAILTAQAIASDGLRLVGWVANRINPGLAHYAEVLEVLRKKIAAPQIGELPYLPRAQQRNLAGYVDLSAVMELKARLTA